MATRTDVEDLRPAAWVFLSGVGWILTADVWLISSDRAPVTAWLRTLPGKAFLVVLAGHVIDVWGPADPFRAVAWLAGRVKGRRLPKMVRLCRIP